jgi:RNA-directed DNA polymerase
VDNNIIPRESEQTSLWSSLTRKTDKPIQEAKQMAVEQTGAASHEIVEGWHDIDWKAVDHNVRRLQARIVKATKEGRWGKVKALQRLLTHSFSGKAVAVRRVTQNDGSNTPGVDQVIWDTPEKKAQAIATLKQRGYHPQPLRRVYVPKRNGKKRPLGIPCMQGRAMQALYVLALDPIAETMADHQSYGFRRERSPADAMERCFLLFSRKTSPQWILEGDIKGCFDAISHMWLLTHIPMEKALLEKWLKAGFMEQGILFPTEAGTPQGGICSPVLANMTLDGLEQKLRDAFPRTTLRGRQATIHLIRYADDFLISGRSKEILEQEVKPLVEQFMRERGLELSQEKTIITHMEEGFDFLGQHVRKYGETLLIKPSKESVQALLGKVRKIIKDNKQTSAGKLIAQLNPILRGWALYHRHVASKKTFSTVDHAIFEMLWRWAKRRHPTKGRRWVKEKYFHEIGSRKWAFSGEIEGKKGEVLVIHLMEAAKIPIRRHRLIQGEANPYDPAWEGYFDERVGAKWQEHWLKRRKLIALWREQEGKCPVCDQKITKESGWSLYHIHPRVYGGTDSMSNLLILHPYCRERVRYQKLSVTKPGADKVP